MGRFSMPAETLFEKIWNAHVVHRETQGPSLIYVDRHFIHEVTSPQAFDSLRTTKRRVRRSDLTFATMDHNVPTTDRSLPIEDPVSAAQIEALVKNCKDFGIRLFDLDSADQGIVHVIGPELGLTLPGTTVVCGDSHTTTHGALGSLAFGVGTSQVEHVLATQCIWMDKPETFEVRIEGRLRRCVTAKDLILHIIGSLGTSGGAGAVVEYKGDGITSLSLEERMTVCNMSIEAGARAGLIAPDNKTFEYLRERRYVPKGEEFERAVEEWKHLRTDEGAEFDRRFILDASEVIPQVTWGTNPSMVVGVTGQIPSPSDFDDPLEQKTVMRALEYMGLTSGMRVVDIKVDRVFIGSCTNGRIFDLEAAASVVKGRKVAHGVHSMVVPGSQKVKREAEEKGLDKIFEDAGFEWRESGCSMCLGMNSDVLQPGERCASTSNRNFEGRQGRGGRTHLVSPIMAAAAALAGHFVDVREYALEA